MICLFPWISTWVGGGVGGYTQHFLFPSQSQLGGFLNDVSCQKTVVDLKGDVLKRLLLEKVVLWGGGAGWWAEQSVGSFHFHPLCPFL